MERCKREGRGEADRGTRRELLSQRAFRAPLARVSSRDDVRSGLFIAVKNTSKCPPSRHGSAGRAIRDVFSLSLFLSFSISLSRPPARSNSPDALSSPTRSYLSFVPTDEVPHSPTLTLGKLATYESRRIQAPRGEVGILFEGQPLAPLARFSPSFSFRCNGRRYRADVWPREREKDSTTRVPRSTFPPSVSPSSPSPPHAVTVWLIFYVYRAYLRLLRMETSVLARLTGYATFYWSSNLCARHVEQYERLREREGERGDEREGRGEKSKSGSEDTREKPAAISESALAREKERKNDTQTPRFQPAHRSRQ